MTDDDYDDDHDELQGIMKDGWTYRPTRVKSWRVVTWLLLMKKKEPYWCQYQR